MLCHAGNPVRSVEIQTFRKGYAKCAREQGYRQTSAKPWEESDVLQVLAFLNGRIAKSTCIEAMLLLRDGFLFSVLWQTKSRGINAGAWRLDNIKLPTGRSSKMP